MKIILAGLNHRTAPIALREQLALTDCALGMALEEIGRLCRPSPNRNGSRPKMVTLKETVILSTCNRLEVYAVVGGDAAGGWRTIEGFLSELQGISLTELQPHLYFKEGNEAVTHLMRVAASLDSMVLGEQQILGQASSALSEARKAGTSGPVLSHLFDLSCHAGKRARTETEIGRHTTSISHAAAQMVVENVSDLERAQVLCIGAGEMIEVAAQALQARGAQQ
jgi:glutamyl-tRNA reductase